jgi:uncharacterized protein
MLKSEVFEHQKASPGRPAGRRPLLFQEWRRLLFLNWAYNAEDIQRTLPKGIEVDLFEGQAYLGIIPFELCRMRFNAGLRLPMLSNFAEINVRTYVRDRHGNPGVWFYSLDADNWMAVMGAQRFFHLPYFHAFIAAERREEDYFFHIAREEAEIFVSHFHWRPFGPTRRAEAESLDHFLLERYRFFAQSNRGNLYYGQIHHEPYPVQEARLELYDENLLPLNGFLKTGLFPDHVAFSPGVRVEAFALRRLK